jgi:hypothetical protein
MTLTPQQKEAVSAWIAAGDNLSAVQKKLLEQFKLSMTYRDVRFLVDDLDLALKDAAPKVDASDVSKVPAANSSGTAGTMKSAANDTRQAEAAGAPAENPEAGVDEEFPADGAASDANGLDEAPAGGGSATVEVDKVTLLPGALASGTVTFSDGVTGKWIVDQYGRPGFTEISQPGYRPSPADGQAFMRELSTQLQRRGF